MKTLRLFLVFLCTFVATFTNTATADSAQELEGAWRLQGSDGRIMIMVDGHLSHAAFDQGQFLRTHGGPFESKDGRISGTWWFDSGDKQRVGKDFSMGAKRNGNQLILSPADGTPETWQRIGEAKGELAGVWRTVGRSKDGTIDATPLRPRRTLKILTGDRFQWIAMNVETGEFFGTGGGTYTLENGKYTEHLEFFSRDNSRVGLRLPFEAEVKDGYWHHRGKSSKGAPVNEVWGKL